MNDIVCFEENTKGSDFIIGDVHGNRNCLRDVVNSLRRGDRLFIVGDLTDRGHDSVGVMDLVLRNRDRVFSVRGNHESECLEVINCLEMLAKKDSYLFESYRFQDFLAGKSCKLKELFADFNEYEDDKCASEYKKIKFDLENDRSWLVDLFCEELDKLIRVRDDNIEYAKDSKIKQIKDYMSNLPYIIHVTGQRPFNVVHADMPFENSVLLQRIQQNNLLLTEEEKAYAPWARGDEKKPFLTKTNSLGIITYVGHNIIEGNDLPIVRRESNTVNIDVGTYDVDTSLVVNHTAESSRFIGSKPPKNLVDKKTELDQFLISQKTPHKRLSNSTNNFFEHIKRRKNNEGELVRISVTQGTNPDSVETTEEIFKAPILLQYS